MLDLTEVTIPETTGIRLRTAAWPHTPSFDSEGQVQGRLEVKVGDDWVTVASHGINFGGDGSSGGEAESTVACRQLGNELGYWYTLVSAIKVGREDTEDGFGMAYKVACAGTESTLDSCTSFEYFRSDQHYYDVGVSCTFLAPGEVCEECVAGKFSDTPGVAGCTSCAAGSYSAVAGSVSAADCQQVRVERRRSERNVGMSLTDFPVAVRGRQGERARQRVQLGLRDWLPHERDQGSLRRGGDWHRYLVGSRHGRAGADLQWGGWLGISKWLLLQQGRHAAVHGCGDKVHHRRTGKQH
jgi:hypothetical protein